MNSFMHLIVTGLILVSSCTSTTEAPFAYGNFEAEEILISSENSGKVIWQDLREGMQLKSGQLLLITDTIPLQLRKEQLQASLQSVDSRVITAAEQVAASRVSHSNLDREQRRLASLFREGAATEKQLDDINGQIELVKAQIRVHEATGKSVATELTTVKIQIKQTEDQIKRCYVYSPANGTVLSSYIHAGEHAVPGRTLFKMADMKTMFLRAYISGEQLGEIKAGDTVKVKVDASGGNLRAYQGVISWISDQSEFTPKVIQTRDERINLVYPVKIRVQNDGYLKIGMPGDVSR